MGCGEEEIRVYSVPKGSETSANQAPAPRNPAAPGPSATVPSPEITVSWQVPDGWQEQPDPPPMRIATFIADTPGGPVEVALTRFPGDVGGVLANVNRWRGQISLPPVEVGDLAGMLSHFERPGFEGYYVHLSGPQQDMLAAGIYQISANETWFLRAVCSTQDANHIKQDFLAFARSIGPAGEAN